MVSLRCATGWFDQDHVGAHVSEQFAGKGHALVSKFDNPHAIQRRHSTPSAVRASTVSRE